MATIAKTTIGTSRRENVTSRLRRARTITPASRIPQGQPQRGADQGRDHALVSDHSTRLPTSESDRAQHAELASALEDRERQRVHHPEQADHDRQREQHVEDVEDHVGATRALVDPAGLGPQDGVQVGIERLVQRGGGLRRRPRVRVDEDEEILRPREVHVERPLREGHLTEQRVQLLRGRIVEPLTTSRTFLPCGSRDPEGAAHLQVMVVGEAMPDDRAVEAERERTDPSPSPAKVIDVADGRGLPPVTERSEPKLLALSCARSRQPRRRGLARQPRPRWT